MVPYLTIALLIIVSNILFYKKSNFNLFGYTILFGSLFLLSVIRDISVGRDFQYYADSFKMIGQYPFHHWKSQFILSKNEYGWYIMNKFFYLYGTFFLYTLCFYFVMYFLIFKSILDKSSIPLFSLLIYFFCGFYFASFNIMRQVLVFSLFLYAIRFIESGEFYKYSTILIVGALFHISALFLIPLYFIKNIKWSRTALIILILVSLLLGYSNFILRITPYIHLVRLNHYINIMHKEISFFGYLIFAVSTTIAIIFLLFSKDINSTGSLYLKFVVFGIIMSNLVMHFQWLFRFSEVYFAPLMIIGYINVVSECKSNSNKYLLSSLLLVYSFLLFYLALANNSNGIIPYKLIFSS